MNDKPKQIRKMIRGSMILTIALFFSQCGDGIPDLKLPADSTSGLNTFGCQVNHHVWTNYGKACYTFGCEDTNLYAELSRTSGGKHEFFLWADYTVNRKRLFQSIQIDISNLTGVGDFDSYGQSIVFIADDHGKFFKTVGAGSTRVSITRYDTINSVISGTFSGILTSENGKETVEIAQGRFDVTIKQYGRE